MNTIEMVQMIGYDLKELQRERDEAVKQRDGLLTALKRLLRADGDHMTACDRTMGATHPCTCGANAARKLLDKKHCPECGGPHTAAQCDNMG